MAKFILKVQNISKSFPGVQALTDINMSIKKGEVHALVGENGAGKSTLVKIIAGVFKQDSGEIYLDGEEVDIETPLMAAQKGISVIYQEFNLFSQLSVAENIFLGREPLRENGLIDWEKIYNDSENILARLGVSLNVKTKIKHLKVAQQQMVEIAKSLAVNSRILIMDEPSATLTDHELKKLFSIIQELKGQGISIIYISHRLEEIFTIGDRVTVLRDGRLIKTEKVAELTKTDIIRMMVGRKLDKHFPKKIFDIGEVILAVKDLYLEEACYPLNLELRQREILGVTGLIGAGRTEFMRAIFGADPKSGGEIFINDKKVEINEPCDAIENGIALVPENRKEEGLFLSLPINNNVTITNLGKIVKRIFIQQNQEKRVVNKYIELINIKTPGIGQLPKNLSGGNQQKVVLAKWFFSKSQIIIFDEPTRGIDVGAKVEIYNLMNRLLEEGKAIIMISSELPEVIGMSDRIMVMHEGKIQGIIDAQMATQEKIMHLATGEEEKNIV